MYEPDNGTTYSKPDDEWDKDFLLQVKNDLDNNFSKSQLLVYEQVAKKVLKEKAAHLEQEEAAEAQPHRSYQEETISNKKMYTGVTVAGAAVAVTGLVLSRMALASLGLAGVVIGGVLLYKESQK